MSAGRRFAHGGAAALHRCGGGGVGRLTGAVAVANGARRGRLARVLAAVAAVPAYASAESGAVGVAEVSSVAMSLIVVVGVILGAAYVLRRTPLGAVGRQSGPLKIVATLPLGPKERLLWVDAGGTELLLAVSPAGIFNVGHAADREPAKRSVAAARREAVLHGERV